VGTKGVPKKKVAGEGRKGIDRSAGFSERKMGPSHWDSRETEYGRCRIGDAKRVDLLSSGLTMRGLNNNRKETKEVKVPPLAANPRTRTRA